MLDFAAGRHRRTRLEKIRKAIALDPSLPEQSRSLAEVLIKAGQPERALAALARCSPHRPLRRCGLGSRRQAIDRKRRNARGLLRFRKGHSPAAGLRHHISTISRWHWSAPTASTRRRSVPKPRCAPTRISPTRMNCWAASSPESGNCRRPRANIGARWNCGPIRAARTCCLGNVLAAQGDISGASEHLREAAKSRDAAIARQAAQALRQIGVR